MHIYQNVHNNIRLYCCDAPARSFICVFGHTAKSDCSKFNQKEGKLHRSGIIFKTTVGDQRKYSYNLRIDSSHHQPQYLNEKHVLESANIGTVLQFSIDLMHMLDLGITKKNITLVISTKNIWSPN